MNSLRDTIIANHIDAYYPNAQILSYDSKDSGLTYHTADTLMNADGDWFPLCCFRDKDTGKLLYGGRSGILHTYTEGETGSGKTTRFVMQSIRALASMKTKPSFLIVDIHGEIIENLHKHLLKNGYKIKILNCDDPEHSDTYNPLFTIAKDVSKSGVISDETSARIRRIAEIMQPIESEKEPIWDQGARSYMNGCILDKMEDLLAGDIPLDCITIYNIIQNHYRLRHDLGNGYGTSDLLSLPHYKEKGTEALSVQKMIGVTNNAEKTRASYYGVIENHLDMFGQSSFYKLSSSSTIDVESFIAEPTALIIQSANTCIGDALVSILVNDIYSSVVRIGKKTWSKLAGRRIHCFLDEFANYNIASGAEFVKMLTTSRKFGMLWHLFLQCDAQLESKFDVNTGRIIRANCTEIYMGTNDAETASRFARSCGHKTIESLDSKINKERMTLETVNVMTEEKLNLTESGCMYIRSNRHPLLCSYFEAFYNCPEFERSDIGTVYPKNDFDYTKTEFFPSDILRVTPEEGELLAYLYEFPCKLDILESVFRNFDVPKTLALLLDKELIHSSDSETIEALVSEKQLNFIKSHSENVSSEEKNVCKSMKPVINLEKTKEAIGLVRRAQLDTVSYDEIRRCICAYDASMIQKFSCFPNDFKEKLEMIYCGVCKKDGCIHNSQAFKYDIIEAFIANNDFDSKQKWAESFRKELQLLRAKAYFPLRLIEIFEEALNEFDTPDFTFENIVEIKKLIENH